MEPKLIDWILPGLVLAIWMLSWWAGTRRFRLWFALLAPFACTLGLILGLIGAGSQADGSCSSSCAGGAVQRWAADFDSPSASVVWLQASSRLALFVAVVLTVLTLVVEYILLVLRDRRRNDRIN
ncbi:hypothetical protein AB0368_18300 [Actinoplanes sp. NPDC051475]|uniref:hypothetical protein n=1 Tax=Actinoplanes sp. NPDC051475 TaxID=3157225 RepID=UPI00344F1D49